MPSASIQAALTSSSALRRLAAAKTVDCSWACAGWGATSVGAAEQDRSQRCGESRLHVCIPIIRYVQGSISHVGCQAGWKPSPEMVSRERSVFCTDFHHCRPPLPLRHARAEPRAARRRPGHPCLNARRPAAPTRRARHRTIPAWIRGVAQRLPWEDGHWNALSRPRAIRNLHTAPAFSWPTHLMPVLGHEMRDVDGRDGGRCIRGPARSPGDSERMALRAFSTGSGQLSPRKIQPLFLSCLRARRAYRP